MPRQTRTRRTGRASTGQRRRRIYWMVASAFCLAFAAITPATLAAASASHTRSRPLVIGVAAVGNTLDTQNFTSGGLSAGGYYSNLSAGLLKFCPLPATARTVGSLNNLCPDLAKSWTVTKTGVIFTLRSAKAPSGDTLDAQDVAYTYQRDVATKDGVGLFLMSLSGVNSKDPITILGPHKVELNGDPDLTPYWPIMTDFYDASILDAPVMQQHATASDPWATSWLTTNSANFGPYQVQSFVPGDRVVLIPNPNYYGGKPAYSPVTITTTGGASVSELLRSNTINASSTIPATDFASLRSDKSLTLIAAPTTDQDTMRLNASYPPLQSADVREAMSLAINRELLVKGPYDNIGTPSIAPVPVSLLPKTGVHSQYYHYSLAKAEALMAESPYPHGFPLSLDVNQGTSSTTANVTALGADLESMLAPLGITISVNVVANPSQFETGEETSYESDVSDVAALLPDALYVMTLAHIPGIGLYTSGTNAQITSVVNNGTPIANPAARARAAVTAVNDWNNEMYDIPLIDTKLTMAVDKGICGLAPSLNGLQAYTLHPCSS